MLPSQTIAQNILESLSIDCSPTPSNYDAEKEIKQNIRNLSYSSLLNLHGCPRRFQLDKISTVQPENIDISSSITFAFGHAVGLGIQLVFEGKSEDEIIWELFKNWSPDLAEENAKQVKSFYHSVFAIQKFMALRDFGFLDEWEPVYYQGKIAAELSFRISFPDGFKFRGFVDLVLRHKETGEVLVLEVKTTSATNLNPATYKNSAQAIGYSVVLETLFPGLTSYQVLYLVYQTKSFEYNPLPFDKSYLQRALWIRELLLDIEVIKLYEEAEVFPMHGESCYDFYRECKYLNLCTLDTSRFITAPSEEQLKKIEERKLKEEQFQIEVDFKDLIQAQLKHV